jgi:hypothetical protein
METTNILQRSIIVIFTMVVAVIVALIAVIVALVAVVVVVLAVCCGGCVVVEDACEWI